jgi:hypothetical protein
LISNKEEVEDYVSLFNNCATIEQDAKLSFSRLREKLQSLMCLLQLVEMQADEIVKNPDPFSFDNFFQPSFTNRHLFPLEPTAGLSVSGP